MNRAGPLIHKSIHDGCGGDLYSRDDFRQMVREAGEDVHTVALELRWASLMDADDLYCCDCDRILP